MLMKPSHNILKSFLFISLIGIVIWAIQGLSAFQQAQAQSTPKTDSSAKNVLLKNEKNIPILGGIPDFTLNSHQNGSVERDDFYNHVWIVNFIDTNNCNDPCKLQMRFMNGLGKLLRPDLGPNIQFVTLSTTRQNNTDRFSKLIADNELDVSQWTFLSGAENKRAALMQMGFNIAITEQPTQALTDTTDIFIIDWENRLRGQYNIINNQDVSVRNDVFTKFKQDLARIVIERKGLPETLYETAQKDPRPAQQKARAKTLGIFTGFSFQDEIKKSGIKFRHKIVDDVGTDYKAIHYDHGNGMAIADVDGDGFEDIYFTSLSGTNELWRNLGDGTFEDITKSSGLILSDRVGMAASFADIDNDGDPDLYITNVREGNVLYENNGKGVFKDISERSGTSIKAHSSGAVFFDYNRDGRLDLFVTNVGKYTTDEKRNVTLYDHDGQIGTNYEYYVGYKDAFAGHIKSERNETSILFKNIGDNRFENVNRETGLIDETWSGDATIIDGNNDGWPDLYVINMQGNDEYYENQKGETFLRKSREVFEKTPWGAMGVRAFDYDNDGDIDLYITDMHSDMRDYIGIDKEKQKSNVQDPESFLLSGGNSLFGNAFYKNNGDGSYTEISDQIGVENYWPWGPSSGDLNADGYDDLFVASSMAYPFRYHINSVLLNNKGEGFIDSEYTLGVEPRRGNIISKPWFEIDCEDQNKDHLVCVNSNTPTSSRTVVWGALGTRSAAIFDLDKDGDQDIVTLEFNHNPMVLISNLSQQKDINFLEVDLTGTQSNRDGLGAKVKVFAGDDIYTKIHDGKSGYLGQSAAPLYFGLGDHTALDKIEITWPSGQRQTLKDTIGINQRLEISEPDL